MGSEDSGAAFTNHYLRHHLRPDNALGDMYVASTLRLGSGGRVTAAARGECLCVYIAELVHCACFCSGNHFCWREHHDWVRVHGVLAVTPWLRYVTNRLICKEPAMPRYSFKLTLVVSLCVFNTEISADRLCSELRQQELW